VWHVFEWQAEWFAEFERCVDAWDEGAYHPRRLPRTRLHDLANQLVNHPKYQVCQSKAQRRYLLEQLLGREFESVRASDLTGVLDRAEAIFELEIKPLERSYLRQRARELKAGMSWMPLRSLGVSRAAAKALSPVRAVREPDRAKANGNREGHCSVTQVISGVAARFDLTYASYAAVGFSRRLASGPSRTG
jgi:hypothetical protein